ncbi:hypothetical protein FF38_03411 [Lucilia cuprina]|uniref:Pro-corazonin n=1 Tax=Lucilia cuprina TaxID=7375 RepID=A0A0L0C0R2_LUCCU|nr:Pro-corazonin [Lucilia cuprina]KNC25893.1 hypothetical protein FF38_03411 [Lucilia cuprina]
MLRIVILPLLIFLFSMACMGQTFQYSRGWTNGKRAGAATTLNNLLHNKEDDGMSELFEVQEANERRLERCLSQLQRFVRNPLLLHTTAALALNPAAPSSSQSSNSNNNMNNIPYGRNHQSNELFEELGAAGTIIDTNDYAKH